MRRIGRVPRCVVLLAMLCTASVAPAQAQPANRLADFLTHLIASACSLDPSFALTPGETVHAPRGQASVTVVSDVDTALDDPDGNDIRALTVIVTHGASSSTHVIFYEDNDHSASLTCGDTIVGVS
jgi:hypothetical protein